MARSSRSPISDGFSSYNSHSLGDHQTGDGGSLASAGVQGLLALEVAVPRRPSGEPREIRNLIREMSRDNWLWGAPRIHGELLKLGIEVAQSTVAKYMVKRPRRPGQSWTTFLRNHAAGIALKSSEGQFHT